MVFYSFAASACHAKSRSPKYAVDLLLDADKLPKLNYSVRYLTSQLAGGDSSEDDGKDSK